MDSLFAVTPKITVPTLTAPRPVAGPQMDGLFLGMRIGVFWRDNAFVEAGGFGAEKAAASHELCVILRTQEPRKRVLPSSVETMIGDCDSTTCSDAHATSLQAVACGRAVVRGLA